MDNLIEEIISINKKITTVLEKNDEDIIEELNFLYKLKKMELENLKKGGFDNETISSSPKYRDLMEIEKRNLDIIESRKNDLKDKIIDLNKSKSLLIYKTK